MHFFSKIIIFNLTFLICKITASDSDIKSSFNDSTEFPYCFRFTWLGPKYNNESLNEFQNVTCDDLDITKSDPCRRPLVVTDNTAIPNTTWLWNDMVTKHRFKEVSCRLAKGDICAKITFSYNQQVENITYMCTKVSIDGEGAVSNGCFLTDHGNGRQTEVCACESSAGQPPCNNVNGIYIKNDYWIFFIIIMTVLYRSK